LTNPRGVKQNGTSRKTNKQVTSGRCTQKDSGKSITKCFAKSCTWSK
jgi:hypothetical protein